MLQENKQQDNIVTVEVNVNPEKAKLFVNDLVRLLNSYGLDGINICNETTVQILHTKSPKLPYIPIKNIASPKINLIISKPFL